MQKSIYFISCSRPCFALVKIDGASRFLDLSGLSTNILIRIAEADFSILPWSSALVLFFYTSKLLKLLEGKDLYNTLLTLIANAAILC